VTHELIQLRADIQILEQAHTLATSTKDEDLSRLIDTWRTATRAVAEELFASTRDRVNGMGGVAAWRDREKEQKEWRTKWDREEMESAREKAAANNEGADDREVETYDERDVEGHEEEQEEKTSGKDDDVSYFAHFRWNGVLMFGRALRWI
jgi:Swi5-dependent recombination DNA repair protein 1